MTLGCEDPSGQPLPKFACHVKLNIISHLPEQLSNTYMRDAEGNEVVFGILVENAHKYTDSPWTFEFTSNWTLYWEANGEQFSREFEIAPEILAEDPIPLQITIDKNGEVSASRYRFSG